MSNDLSTEKRGTSIVLEVDPKDTPKQAMTVTCVKCEHAWIGLYLPMPISDAARVMKNLTCPQCAATSKDIRVKS